MLERIRIDAYSKPDYSGGIVGTFEAFVNPNELTIAYEIEYDSAQGSGTTNSRMEFKKMKPGDLTIAFFLDGTGANGSRADVQQMVEEFQTVTGYDGDIHRTKYLKIAWGTIAIKSCVLKSASIAYKLFKPNGIPLRAVITAVFTENSDDQTRVAKAQDESPDLTHVRLIRGGDTLPALCYQIYGDPGYYLDVARANRIDNFRNLVPGTRVFFPPLEK
ncbi:MAG TPA: hypothetical protein VHI13_22585 [Candidatus Kapabacteria bacterium]|nr:hypothetical protein [Candidatus Kapabacteria bacterium]